MRIYFSLLTGMVSLGIELLVVLALMELPPFGKGASNVIWALPFFGLIVFAIAISGLAVALAVRKQPGASRWALAGLLMNVLSLAIPIVVLVLGIGRIFL